MSIFEKVGENEWRFIEFGCVRALMEEFHEALDYLDGAEFQLGERMLRSIIDRCPEHVDAIHHLALISEDEGRDREYHLLEKEAVDIALKNFPKEFRLGEDLLEWGWLENRPFLRAYHGLGFAHLKRGSVKEALNIFLNLLSFNPNDNQGIRGVAVECFFDLDEPENVLSICDKYSGDTTPQLLYGRPLALIQLDRLSEAREAVKEAVAGLPFVAKELLKKRHVRPKSLMDGYVTSGGKDEAYFYWETSGSFWKNTKGALDLLKKYSR